MAQWTFFSNHGHIIVLLGINPETTYREIADEVGITERFAKKIVADLVTDGYVEITKKGRKNVYKVLKTKPLRHKIESACKITDIISLIKSKQ